MDLYNVPKVILRQFRVQMSNRQGPNEKFSPDIYSLLLAGTVGSL
jgi:hypothetical protein